jgi:hypothetical protein
MTHRSICLCDVPVVSDVRRFRSEEARREELSKETRAEPAHRKAQIKHDSLQPFYIRFLPAEFIRTRPRLARMVLARIGASHISSEGHLKATLRRLSKFRCVCFLLPSCVCQRSLSRWPAIWDRNLSQPQTYDAYSTKRLWHRVFIMRRRSFRRPH